MKKLTYRRCALHYALLFPLTLLAASCTPPIIAPTAPPAAQQTATQTQGVPTTTFAPPSSTPETSAGSEVVLDGGVRISYTTLNGPGAALFRVDELAVYSDFAALEQDWTNRSSSPTLIAVLSETAAQSNSWQLRYSAPLSGTLVNIPQSLSGAVTPVGWSEFTLTSAAGLSSATGDLPPLAFGPVTVDEGDRLMIVVTELFTPTADLTFIDSLGELPNPERIKEILISELVGEQSRYTLAVIDPEISAGVPPGRGWCTKQSIRARRGVCRRVR